jgi:polyribonucleotide nucleotidyltransferase
MFDVSRVSVEISDTEISFETGKLARQASGSVVVTAGETIVLCTATAGGLRDVDFLPLTVDVEERHYAAGKIPGSFFRREGRPGEKGILTARMIDRPIRPLFPKGWHFETQLVCQPLSAEHDHPYDILAMNGASAALAISHIPVAKHVGSVRVGKLDGDFVVNPREELYESLEMDLVVAGTDEAVLMVECGAQGVTEAEILDALDIAHSEIKTLCATIEELRQKAGKPKVEVEVEGVDEALVEEIRGSHGSALDEATQVPEKLARQDAIDAVKEQVVEKLAPPAEGDQPDPEHRPGLQVLEDPAEALPAIPHLYFVDPVEGTDREGRQIVPEFVVDIAAQMDTKRALLLAHESQRAWLLKQHGMDDFIGTMEKWTSSRGALAGIEWGEGFRQYSGHAYPRTPRLQELLGTSVYRLAK